MKDLAQQVTDKIIAELEDGVAPWVRPWNSTSKHGGMPYNASSGKPYRGINVALLYAPQFASSAWLTFKQAQALGASVRKGERGSMIVFYKPLLVKDKNAVPRADGSETTRSIPLLRCFHVFNVAQIDGLPDGIAVSEDTRTESQRHAMAESIMAQANVVHGGDRACFVPSADVIRLPQPGAFNSMGDYYATALHELTHWTGAESRLARKFSAKFGDKAYAREELVAEMGAAFLCAYAGIPGKLQHAAYISHWLDVLREDKNAILRAASMAQKAADYAMQFAQGTQDAQGEQSADEESEAIAA